MQTIRFEDLVELVHRMGKTLAPDASIEVSLNESGIDFRVVGDDESRWRRLGVQVNGTEEPHP